MRCKKGEKQRKGKRGKRGGKGKKRKKEKKEKGREKKKRGGKGGGEKEKGRGRGFLICVQSRTFLPMQKKGGPARPLDPHREPPARGVPGGGRGVAGVAGGGRGTRNFFPPSRILRGEGTLRSLGFRMKL